MSQATRQQERTPRSENQRPQRKERKPFGGAQQKLAVDRNIPGYRLYWFNDEPGRIPRAQEAGYDFVYHDELNLKADLVTSANMDEGSKVKRLVGTNASGDPLYAYLMKIPEEFFQEDFAAAQKRVDDIDRSIKGGHINKVENRYVPDKGEAIKLESELDRK